jgi:ABC-type multidrug transport system fused ATPase/permease subunit
MFTWFETRIEAFPDESPVRPPDTLLAFYVHFIRPVWPVFAILLVAGFAGALIEVALMAFVGNLVDLMKGAQTPADFVSEHGHVLLWMAFVAVVARPMVSTAHDLIKNQIIAGPVTTRVRWLTHRYVLRQSLGYFQNDFAGRVANKVMQAAPALRDSVVQIIDAVWYAGVQWVGTAVVFASADPLLLVPLVVWLAAYIVVLFIFVPMIKERSTEAAEARSMLVGRIVDTYTNILTVKLFAHADREDAYARAALEEQMGKWQASLRVQTSMELVLYTAQRLLIVGASGLAIWLWSQEAVSIGAIAVVTGLVMRIVAMSGWILWVVAGIFENIGVVQEGMESHQPAEHGRRPAAASRWSCARARSASRTSASTTARRWEPARAAGRHHPRLLASDRAGREGRAGRPLRCRQVDAGQSAAALLRPGVGPHPDRRPGHRPRHAGQPAGADRHGDAGHLAAAPLGARQYPLRQPGASEAAAIAAGQEGARPTTSSAGWRT